MIKLNLRLLLIFLEIAVIPVTLISYLALFNTKSAITNQVLNQLDQLASITTVRVKAVVAENFKTVKEVGLDQEITEATPLIGSSPAVLSDLNQKLDEYAVSLDEVRKVSILNTDGVVVASSFRDDIGKNVGAQEYFFKAKSGQEFMTFFQGQNRRLVVVVSGPIRDGDELIGVVAIEKGGSGFLSIFNENVGLGSSGEIILVSRSRSGDAAYVTPSRFDQLGPLARTTLKDDFGQSVTQAMLGNEQTYADNRDYRGEEVLAATRYIAEMDWGLVAKMDQDEAYLSIAKLRGLLIVVSLVSVSVIALISLSAATSIVAPIKRLIDMTNKISGGDFSHRAVVESRDEIGQLELSFNTMATRLKKSYESLEQKVRERTKELEISKRNLEMANANLKNLDKLKDEFVSIASHELRTPMTAIKGLISMIFEGDYGKVQSNLREPLSDIASSTDRLIVLVNELLNVSRIEAGRLKYELKELTIEPVADEIVTSLSPIAKEKNLDLIFHYDDLTFVQGDVSMVREVLSNLIGNALKFTDRGSVKVEVKKEGEMAKVFVTDTGLGISSEDQKKLFGKFRQISSYQIGKPSGSGLGLYISRELTRKTGGDLWIEKSEPGKGSTFAFSVPLAKTKLAAKVKTDALKRAKKRESQSAEFKL